MPVSKGPSAAALGPVAGDGTRRPPPVASLSTLSGGRARAAREIVASLQGDIAAGRLPLGARLPNERDLAQHFGVSQPTVREAVRAMELMGLLDVRHGSGVYVTGDVASFLSTSLRLLLQVERVGVLEILDVRILLAGHSARRAAEQATDDEIARMADCLDRADDPSAGPLELADAIQSFQLAVSAAARNPLLFAIESFLVKNMIRMQLTAYADRDASFWVERVASASADRRRLLDYIAAHDGEGAVHAIQMYLRTQLSQSSTEPELATVDLTDPPDADPLGDVGPPAERR